METNYLARLRAQGPRRVLAIAAVALLGVGFLSLAVAEGMGAGWRIFLFALSFLMVWGAWAIHKATQVDIFLTREALVDGRGLVLASFDNIEAIERGVFAVKPTSGFLVRLKRPMPFHWAPGAWWRIGRRIGVGGSVSGLQAKAMAEILELAIADRDGKLKRD